MTYSNVAESVVAVLNQNPDLLLSLSSPPADHRAGHVGTVLDVVADDHRQPVLVGAGVRRGHPRPVCHVHHLPHPVLPHSALQVSFPPFFSLKYCYCNCISLNKSVLPVIPSDNSIILIFQKV